MQQPQAQPLPNKVESRNGRVVAVSSGHHLASQAAVDTYRQSGNVIDAAIVGAGVLGSLLPYACGIGGDAYLLYYNARNNKVYSLNGTGAAPSGATPDRFGDRMPNSGIQSSTIPGALALWEDALARFGTLSLAEALLPAIRYARDGFPVHLGLVENIEEKHALIQRNAEAARLFLPKKPLIIGDLFTQPDLRRVLEQIAERGAHDFYRGKLALELTSKIVDAGGLFATSDFYNHETLEQNPIGTSFYGHEVLTMPPNSVGLHLLLQLRALESIGISDCSPDGIDFWRNTIAAWRWALAVSGGMIGDPSEKTMDLAKIALNMPIPLQEVFEHKAPRFAAQSADTSNLVIMDHDGNAVSLVQSVSAPFASGVVLPGTGILMNNRMRGFSTEHGSINRVGPGRRPKHTLVPALVMKAQRAVMAIGTPGAAGQPLTLAQVLARILAHSEDPKDAIQAPRWSVGLNNEIIVEKATPSLIIEDLRRDEPEFDVMSERHVRFGSVKSVAQRDGGLQAVADYRRVAGTASD